MLIIPGNFSDARADDLLFYDPSAEVGEFHSTDGQGNITLVKSNSGWRNTWSVIMRGNFTGSRFDDLLFYDPTAGVGEFYSTDGQHHERGARSFVAYAESCFVRSGRVCAEAYEIVFKVLSECFDASRPHS